MGVNQKDLMMNECKTWFHEKQQPSTLRKSDSAKSPCWSSPFSDPELYNPDVHKWAYSKHYEPARKRIRVQLAPRRKAAPRKIAAHRPPNPLISALLSSRPFDTNHWQSICDLTLTLKQRSPASGVKLDEHECKEAFRFFMRLLNDAVYGNAARRFDKRVKVIPVLEKSPEGRWHLHAAMELPAYFTFQEFEKLVRECWARVHWAYDVNLIRDNADRGWVHYMLKPGQKSGLESWSDSIIWECLYNPIADA